MIKTNRYELVNIFIFSISSILTGPVALAGIAIESINQTICGPAEPALFEQWSVAAGKPSEIRTAEDKYIEDVSLIIRPSQTLRGYKLKSLTRLSDQPTKGYVLIVQGNAMLADQIVYRFQDFTSVGYDVYVFDYRGYGRSDGIPRFKAILDDYRSLIEHLDALPYESARFYGMSFGGVVLMNALRGRSKNMRVVIDSTRSRFEKYGCPSENDAIENLPADCSNFLFITGLQDRIVTPKASNTLVNRAKECGANIYIDPDLNHPMMDRNDALQTRRMQVVTKFLFQSE